MSTPRGVRALPRSVWALGFTSLFMDVSSEMIHGLLPVFLVSVLGAGAATVGLLEGIAEAVPLLARAVSGAASDWMGRRKTLAVAGYGLSALTKPLFALATGVGLVFVARTLDRVGKGVRGAPRDALIADVTPQELRGTAYGLRQSLDTAGAFLGPLLAVVLMRATGDDFRAVFWVAFLPAILCVAILVTAVHEPAHTARAAGRPWHRGDLSRLGSAFWKVVAVGVVFTLARFSEAFLLLRGADVGLRPAYVPLILVGMNLVYMLTAYPAGRLSDRVGRTGLLALSLAALIVADLALGLARHILGVIAGAGLWGAHLGLSQGLLSAIVADAAPENLRGTAFGIFGIVTAVCTLVASAAAGWLWTAFGPPAAFLTGATLAAMALSGFGILRLGRVA